MARILCVGIATLDIINHVERYPAEDSEVRASAQQLRRAGNAANTAVVLFQLGEDVSWVGNLSDQPEAELVREDFARHGVDIGQAGVVPGGRIPTSYITLSGASGSRTIVHCRDLPEYSAMAFSGVDLKPFDWVHFEGRAIDQLGPMLARVRAERGMPVSLEVEKPRAGIEALFDKPDLLMFSRDYLDALGALESGAFLRSLPVGRMATCTRGEAGAWARDAEGNILHAEAHRPDRVLDTIGAGDVFNAGLLHALVRGGGAREALQQATRLAGRQCGREGLVLENDRGE